MMWPMKPIRLISLIATSVFITQTLGHEDKSPQNETEEANEVAQCGSRPSHEMVAMLKSRIHPFFPSPIITQNWTIYGSTMDMHESDLTLLTKRWKEMNRSALRNETDGGTLPIILSPGGTRDLPYSLWKNNGAVKTDWKVHHEKILDEIAPFQDLVDYYRSENISVALADIKMENNDTILFIFQYKVDVGSGLTVVRADEMSYQLIYEIPLPERVTVARVLTTVPVVVKEHTNSYSLLMISNGLFFDFIALPNMGIDQDDQVLSSPFIFTQPIMTDTMLGCPPIVCLDSRVDAAFNIAPVGRNIRLMRSHFRWDVEVRWKPAGPNNNRTLEFMYGNSEATRFHSIDPWGASHVDAAMMEPNGNHWIFSHKLVWLVVDGNIHRGYPASVARKFPLLEQFIPIDAAVAYIHSRYIFSNSKVIHLNEKMDTIYSVTDIASLGLPPYLDAAVYIPKPLDALVAFKNNFVYTFDPASGLFDSGRILSACEGYDYAAAGMGSLREFLERIESGKPKINIDKNTSTAGSFPVRGSTSYPKLTESVHFGVRISLCIFIINLVVVSSMFCITNQTPRPRKRITSSHGPSTQIYVYDN